jgi:hypothetical protein
MIFSQTLNGAKISWFTVNRQMGVQSRPQIFIPLAPQISLETAKTIYKILVDDLIFENLQF